MNHKTVEKVLRDNGWVLTRTKGSHAQYKKPGVDYVATVSRHSGKDIPIGTLKDLEKGTGLSFR